VLPGWEKARLTRKELREAFRSTNLNIGLVLNQSDLIDVECDSDEAEANLQAMFGGKVPPTPTWRSKRGLHRLFRRPPGLPEKATLHLDAIEFRIGNGKGALSIVPPSVHPDGPRYEWLPELSLYEVEPAELPPEVVERLRTPPQQPAAGRPTGERNQFQSGKPQPIKKPAALGPARGAPSGQRSNLMPVRIREGAANGGGLTPYPPPAKGERDGEAAPGSSPHPSDDEPGRLTDDPELREAFERARQTHLDHQDSDPQARLHSIGKRFEGFRRSGEGYMARCPAHDDTNPSLSIREGKDGRILIHCFAGCLPDLILEKVALRMADLMPGAKPPHRLVATYDYRDASGRLLYQSLRYDPKNFQCRRPNESGGWIWKGVFDGIERVPYRLPGLLAADPSQPVFIVEGEKDADRLTSLRLTATTNVGGAGKWRPEYNQHFAGKHVVLLPDNDDPGREHTAAVVRHLTGTVASIKVVELPDLPEKGDVSDWLDKGGTPLDLLNLVARTADRSTRRRDDETNRRVSRRPGELRPDESGDPSSRRPGGSVDPFPVEVFPKRLQRFINSVAAALPCPPDFPGALMLPVLSAFIGRKRSVEVKPGWVEHPVLWVACVARSGDRKTPAFEKVTGPLRRKQKELLARYLQEKEEHESLSGEEKKETPPPRLRQILTTDATIEALKEVLDGNPDGIIFLADELSGWARGMSQYKGGREDDRQHWLSLWSGIQVVCNRKGMPGPLIVNDPFVSVTGGIQPAALGDLIDDGREDGFSARILFSYPDPIPPAEWNEVTVEGSEEYARACKVLWDLGPLPEPVKLSPAAKARWVEWVNGHRKEEPPDNLRPFWSKCEGYCARLALILFLARRACGETKAPQVDERSIDGAARLISYFWSHARRVYGAMAVEKDSGRIGRALRWVRTQGGTVSARKAHQYGLCKDSEEAKQLFRDLAELGYGKVTEEPRKSVVFRLLGVAPSDTRRDDEREPGPPPGSGQPSAPELEAEVGFRASKQGGQR
jgi:hypothetical protein